MESLNQSMKSLTAIIRKGEKQFVALCPEVDVVSQGYTKEEALKNLKEAVELYLEEEGFPEKKETDVIKFDVQMRGKTAKIVR